MSKTSTKENHLVLAVIYFAPNPRDLDKFCSETDCSCFLKSAFGKFVVLEQYFLFSSPMRVGSHTV